MVYQVAIVAAVAIRYANFSAAVAVCFVCCRSAPDHCLPLGVTARGDTARTEV